MFPRLFPCYRCGRYYPINITPEQHDKIDNFIETGDYNLIDFLNEEEETLILHCMCPECYKKISEPSLPTDEELKDSITITSY